MLRRLISLMLTDINNANLSADQNFEMYSVTYTVRKVDYIYKVPGTYA